LYGAFVWARRALNGRKRRFPARAVCIVSNIIVAHMTRWQLVMEDAGVIWLGRGAPQRWFKPGVGGFNVTAAPTTVGKIDFKMHVSAAGAAAYTVTAPGHSAAQRWSLRWPGKLEAGSAKATGCTIVAEAAALGIVTCVAQVAEFHVAAQWSPTN
jgi:hypothetical protein